MEGFVASVERTHSLIHRFLPSPSAARFRTEISTEIPQESNSKGRRKQKQDGFS